MRRFGALCRSGCCWWPVMPSSAPLGAAATGTDCAALAALPRVDIGGFSTVRLDEHLALVALGRIGRARAQRTIAQLLSMGNPSSRRRATPEMTAVHWVDAAGFDTLAWLLLRSRRLCPTMRAAVTVPCLPAIPCGH